MLNTHTILTVITGGIAAYKSLEILRLLRARGAQTPTVLTRNGRRFVTPLSIAALAGTPPHTTMFDPEREARMSHITLARECSLVLVAPATANTLARLAHGIADDLASTTLLATDKPIVLAPAMNPHMWSNPATAENIATLRARGMHIIAPASGDTACGETGEGRMASPAEIVDTITALLHQPLAGYRALVTAGPTHEPMDPVRFITNASSGKQGYAIARALAGAGADTHLVSGPCSLPAPQNVSCVKVQTAQEMLAACEASLPVDIAVCAAAVADWRPNTNHTHKHSKESLPPTLTLSPNPDILATISSHPSHRPSLVVGFAAETGDAPAKARAKHQRKGCDWMVANDVSPHTDTIGGDENQITLITQTGEESWPRMSKGAIATELAMRVHAHLTSCPST